MDWKTEIKYIVDTNIFLEYLLEQNNMLMAEQFLRYVRFTFVKVVVSRFSIISIVLIGHRKKIDSEIIHNFIEAVESEPNFLIEDFELSELNQILKLADKNSLDFDDAVILSLAQKYNCPIVSFDKDFDKVNIERLEPMDIIQCGKI